MKNEFRKELENIQNDLFRFALKLTMNRDDANDLLQETSLKALKNESKYTPGTNFRGWMYTIMRNIFINDYRQVAHYKTYPINYAESIIDRSNSIETTHELKEIYQTLNGLLKEYKIPFSMFISGFKYREIAEKLNLPIGTVKSRIFYTRSQLQPQLKDFQ